MPEHMNIDPEALRRLAQRHREIADETRKWAQPPSEWLDSFLDTYGKIAHPVHQALTRYYAAREQAGHALADEHHHTAQSLHEAAQAYEDSDTDNSHAVRTATNNGHGGAAQLAATGPSDGPGSSSPPGGPGGGPSGGPPPGGPSPDPGSNGSDRIGTGPQDPSSPAGGHRTPQVAGPNTAGPAGVPAAAGDSGAGDLGAPGSVVPSAGSVAPGAGTADDRSSGASERPDAMPMPMTTPFAAAVAKAKDEAAEPAYVVGDEVDDDLVLARTLLAGVLAAADPSPVGLHWSVSVLRGPTDATVFITSNEGRGWLPPGVFLPQGVSTPWQWEQALSDADEAGSPWEGVSDPARILAEFALAWGPRSGARMTALVSSAPLDPGLRSRLPDVSTADLVGPSYDVDLRRFTPDTDDRLGLTGSSAALQRVASVPDDRLPARCLELAADAHEQVGRAGAVPAEAAPARGIRQRILGALRTGRNVPADWWQELRDADDLTAAAMLSYRVDVGRVEPGELRVDDNPALRMMVFERRCNELALLLADADPTRQHLRDAVYAHEQIVEHPRFVPTPDPVSTTEPERVERPSVPWSRVGATDGQVTAPSGVSAPASTVTPLSAVSPPDVRGPS